MKIAVVGAGIIGVTIACRLLTDGHQVCLIDREEPGNCCSKGNAGALNPGSCIPLSGPGVMGKVPGYLLDPLGPLHITPRYLLKAMPWLLKFAAAGSAKRVEPIANALFALHSKTFENLQPLLDRANCDHLIKHSGSLIVYKSKKSFLGGDKDWGIRAKRGIRQERIYTDDLRDLVPSLSTDYLYGVSLPDHGFVTNPLALTQALVSQFIKDGGSLIQAKVNAINSIDSQQAQVTTDTEKLKVDRVVLSAGAWSGQLLKPLGINLPLETQRGYHVMVENTDQGLSLPVISSEAKVYATPMQEGLRFAGTVEFGGLNAPPNYKRADALKILAAEMFPKIKIEKVTRWMGHRPCFPDSLPVIGSAPNHPSIMLAFGHGHYGLTAASTTARLVTEMISDREHCIDATPYRANRF